MGGQQSADELADLAELMAQEPLFDGRGPVDDGARRARRRRGLIVVALVLTILLIAAGGYTAWALTAALPAPVATSHEPAVTVPGAAAIALPSDGSSAISVGGAEDYLGSSSRGIWLKSGSDEARPIASISKLITALVVLDAHPLAEGEEGPTITFGKAAHDLYDKYYVLGATVVRMPTGTTMSLREALATMLIPSASNYAEAVSTWAFGSQGAFVAAARQWLAEHELTGTTFVEPTGISALNTSTPRDLIRIGRFAAANPVIAGLVGTESIGLPGAGRVFNTNSLLGDGGVTGLKTGNLGPGQYNLLYSATVDVGAGAPLAVIGVILGGASREAVDSAVLTQLDSIRAGFHDVPLVQAGQEIGSYTTAWGSSARLVVSEDASIFTWSDTPIDSTMTVDTPQAYEDGEAVGSITWIAGPKTAKVSVEVEGTIDPPTAWWRLTHPSELGGP